jgi:phosphoglycolate phosphatase-like HAD superfamily hydrolase
MATGEAEALRSQVDAVVFDMDGVLLDITESIRSATCLAIPLYYRAVLGRPAPDSLISPADIELFKFAGGFNDDGDLIQAIVLYLLVQQARCPGVALEALKAQTPTIAEFAAEVKHRGGWLKNAEAVCLEGLEEPSRSSVLAAYRRRSLLQCFEELLAGPSCSRLYGYDPELYRGRGFFESDRPLLDVGRLPAGKTIAVQTGRTYPEAKLGLDVAGLSGLVDDTRLVTERDGFHKPEPGGLLLLAKRFRIRTGIYVGDTIDDLRTVRNYNNTEYANSTGSRFLIALVLTGPLGTQNESVFREEGPDILASDVNAVMDWITG